MNGPKETASTQPTGLERITLGPLPASRKVYVPGSIFPDIRVPAREIALAAPQPPVTVYDTSGPYTDAHAAIDVRSGLPKHRTAWLAGRESGTQLEHARRGRITEEME